MTNIIFIIIFNCSIEICNDDDLIDDDDDAEEDRDDVDGEGDGEREPDLDPLCATSRIFGKNLKKLNNNWQEINTRSILD